MWLSPYTSWCLVRCRWFLLPGLCLALFHTSYAQYNGRGLGTWNLVNLRYIFDDKWSVFGEAQLRSLKFYNDFHYHEFKAGVQYRAMPQLSLALGAGQYDTYLEGGNFLLPKNTSEFRIWPQIVVNTPLNRLKLEQRMRTEFRFTTVGYRFRLRYRVGLAYAFGQNKEGFVPYQLSASSELFFSNREPYFERNRLSINFNYQVSQMVTLQTGYIHQFDYRINDEIGRDFFQLGLFLDLHKLRRTGVETKDNF